MADFKTEPFDIEEDVCTLVDQVETFALESMDEDDGRDVDDLHVEHFFEHGTAWVRARVTGDLDVPVLGLVDDVTELVWKVVQAESEDGCTTWLELEEI